MHARACMVYVCGCVACACVFAYTCLFACACIHVHVCLMLISMQPSKLSPLCLRCACVCMCICVCMCMCAYVRVHICVRVEVRVRVRVLVCVCVRLRACVRVRFSACSLYTDSRHFTFSAKSPMKKVGVSTFFRFLVFLYCHRIYIFLRKIISLWMLEERKQNLYI